MVESVPSRDMQVKISISPCEKGDTITIMYNTLVDWYEHQGVDKPFFGLLQQKLIIESSCPKDIRLLLAPSPRHEHHGSVLLNLFSCHEQ